MIDFEGEPARGLTERRRKRSPLRDVAGMLRSFAYAASASELERGVKPPDDWEERARAEFLAGYLEEVDSSIIPAGQAFDRLLALFELEKAVYELRYELDNRPDWVRIPVGGHRAAPGGGSERRRRARRRAAGGPAQPPRRAPAERQRRRARIPSRGGERQGAGRGRGAGRARAGPSGRPVRGQARRRRAAAPLPARGAVRGGRDARRRRPVRVPAHARRARPPPGRGGPARADLRAPRRARARGRRRRRHRVRRLGAVGALGERGRRLQPLGRPPPPDALARPVRHLGAVRSRARRGRPLQVRASHAGGRDQAQDRPARVRDRGSAEERLDRLPLRRTTGATTSGSSSAAATDALAEPVSIYEVHLGSWRRHVADNSAAELHRAGRRARRLRDGHGLHPRRAAARDGAPVQRLVGLPGHRLLRADRALRRARRLPRLRRPPPPARPRRDPRLGAGALPARRLGARALRRHGALRARGPAARLPPRLGHAGLQLRPQRGAQLPARQRALLAARVPRRRAQRRRGRLDALPRLLARGGPVGAERVRRQRGPRRRPVPQGAERARPRPRAGHALGRRGVHGLAGSVATDLPRRARLRVQVEHGLDARHAGLLPARPGAPPLPPPPADLRARVRVLRELRAAALARRGRPRQGLAAREDARRPLAEVRQPARALRLHVGAPRQEAPLHGRRARPGGGVVGGAVGRLAPARAGRPRRRAVARPRPQPRLPLAAGAVGGRLRAERLPVAGAERRDATTCWPSRAGRADGSRRRRLRLQPLARAARGLPARDAARRAAGSRR